MRLWDYRTGQCLRLLSGHTNKVWSVCFSADGHTLVSGSLDETIRLWDVQTREWLHTLRSERPYERMNIADAKGLTAAQVATLKALGAVETVSQVKFCTDQTTPRGRYCSASAKCITPISPSPDKSAMVRASLRTR